MDLLHSSAMLRALPRFSECRAALLTETLICTRVWKSGIGGGVWYGVFIHII